MVQIEVPEKAAAELQELALRDDRPLPEILTEAITSYISFRHHEPKLTPAEVDRMKHSMAQADRGELVPQEEVEAFFDNWDQEIASR